MLATWLIYHLMCGIYVGLPNGPVFLCDNGDDTLLAQGMLSQGIYLTDSYIYIYIYITNYT